jgi:hypothetical protein
MNRRTFILGLSALLVGCGGGSGGRSTEVLVPSTPTPAPSPQDPVPGSPTSGSLSYEGGYYIVRDNNTMRVKVGAESLEGSHVVEPDRVTVYYENGSSIVIGRF